MKLRKLIYAGLAAAGLAAGPAHAVELSIVHGAIGKDNEVLRAELDRWEKQTGNTVKIVSMPESTTDQFGQYKLWLSAKSSDIDVYRLDVVWAPQLADHFVDLNEATKDIQDQFIPSTLKGQMVDGKLVALPMFIGAPALYYREDLLKKYDRPVPKTWAEMKETAQIIQDGEREAGNKDMQGFVFQGAAYEGLTCNAMEWIASYGGGNFVEPDGSIDINNAKAAEALNMAASWIGTIAPEGVLNYKEEDARGVFQSGDAVFMRNWNYAYALVNGDDSPVKGKVGVSELPKGGEDGKSAATLGGWELAVSKYSKHQQEAIDLVKFLDNYESQKERAIVTSRPPTLTAVYNDPEVAKEQPFIPLWKPVLDGTLARPSAAAKRKYNEASSLFWTAVHNTLSGDGSAEDNLAMLEAKLKRLKGDAW
ncbi:MULTISPECIES: ABC transporter substrate-binding protein [Thioclava]|uniref:ABC transporter substrate-binding protein n=1 Tax=Thioclava TaxID=285107 RepID=UPI000C62AD23|nr:MULTISPECIES: ABC transporter substrate-binding protein [Thioclava]MAQ39267.1 ABC transporter substrate-binding protein [Thioclava sp.]|tara:strand:+ start:2099 stop:3364 length:1266 start_codon:yes stop_codon:yes gene_type:complete